MGTNKSKDKGTRNEAALKKLLRDKTGLKWERTPGSGALDEKHFLKGDLYVPNEKNIYSVEVKAYKDNHLNHTLLLGTNCQLDRWWEQTDRQGEQMEREGLLIFKHDRSKWICMFQSDTKPKAIHLYYSKLRTYICRLEEWLELDNPEFIL